MGEASGVNVALLIFNRPELTQRTVEAIRAARPGRLLVVADGPRPSHPGDEALCRDARRVAENFDSDVKVQTHYADTNMGCRRRVSSGLDWVFSQVEEAIILEDDCLPSSDFFPFAQTLLERYRDDQRVMHIGGSRLCPDEFVSEYTYFFTRHVRIWGWATWRRAWRYYDEALSAWPDFRERGWLDAITNDPKEAAGLRQVMDAVHHGHLDTWDWQWAFACWTRGGLAVEPSVNLISNIGFGSNATHTKENDLHANRPMIRLPSWAHPPYVLRNLRAEEIERNANELRGNVTRQANERGTFGKHLLHKLLKGMLSR